MTIKDVYEALVKEGWTKKDAAKEAQARTGYSVVTGKPIKQKQLKFSQNTKGVKYGGQYYT